MSHKEEDINDLKNRIQELEAENSKLKDRVKLSETHQDTVKTPEAFRPIFDKAQNIVKDYFSSIELSPEQGTITINDDRYVLVRASSLSYNFFKEIKNLYADEGEELAFSIGQNFLFDIGHVLGIEDAKQFHKRTKLEEPIEKLSAGPVHFAHSGWAFVEILPESSPSQDENFYLKYNHPYSFEADSWIKKGMLSDKPVCIMNAAYSSGWCEQSYGIKLTAVEISCKAKGDDNCTFIMAPPHKINEYLPKEEKLDKAAFKVPVFFERKHIEEEIKSSLSEKETLLKEIHHRVKNNLQIITSLLNLQFKNVENKEMLEAITKSKNRINSMALIHSRLYQSGNLSSIDFGGYLDELVESIKDSYGHDENVNFTVEHSDAFFNIDLSINLGLITNELITNSYKHAFKNGESGNIHIQLNNLGDNHYQLKVKDDGEGLPDNIDLENPSTFGLEIISALTEQIGGEIQISSEDGFECTILFDK